MVVDLLFVAFVSRATLTLQILSHTVKKAHQYYSCTWQKYSTIVGIEGMHLSDSEGNRPFSV